MRQQEHKLQCLRQKQLQESLIHGMTDYCMKQVSVDKIKNMIIKHTVKRE